MAEVCALCQDDAALVVSVAVRNQREMALCSVCYTEAAARSRSAIRILRRL